LLALPSNKEPRPLTLDPLNKRELGHSPAAVGPTASSVIARPRARPPAAARAWARVSARAPARPPARSPARAPACSTVRAPAAAARERPRRGRPTARPRHARGRLRPGRARPCRCGRGPVRRPPPVRGLVRRPVRRPVLRLVLQLVRRLVLRPVRRFARRQRQSASNRPRGPAPLAHPPVQQRAEALDPRPFE